ncbi:MAG: Uncharacterised protein [Hyphomonas sp. TMED17]|nr:MAG: Uncharacterised protein [Hyphomonas sp. TMED17]
MRDAAGFKRITKRPDHRLLPDEIGKQSRPVFARQNFIILRRRAAHLCLFKHGKGLIVCWMVFSFVVHIFRYLTES